MAPHASVGVELNQELIEELNEVAVRLNVSRQDLIKLLIRQGLDQHYLAQKARKAG